MLAWDTFITVQQAADNYKMDEYKLRLDILRVVISEHLEMAQQDHIYCLIDVLDENLSEITKKLKELEKYDKHRHKSFFGLYTERPVY